MSNITIDLATLSADQLTVLRALGIAPTVTEGKVEATTPVATTDKPAITVRKSSGLIPLFKVRYTSASGRTDTYGVFWAGPDRADPSKERYGLKPMHSNGSRMVQQNSRQRSSKGFFVDATKCEVI